MEEGSRSPEVEGGRAVTNIVASDSGRDVLSILSESIEAAGAANPRRWSLTQSKRRADRKCEGRNTTAECRSVSSHFEFPGFGC